MSRRPGIGRAQRDKYPNSWRAYAVVDGKLKPVPRYLHEAWKNKATPEEVEHLEKQRAEYALTRNTENKEARRRAAEIIAQAQQERRGLKRRAI